MAPTLLPLPRLRMNLHGFPHMQYIIIFFKYVLCVCVCVSIFFRLLCVQMNSILLVLSSPKFWFFYLWIHGGGGRDMREDRQMHTCTLCTNSTACESFWSASRIRSVSLWMMTSRGPWSSRGWLRSSWRQKCKTGQRLLCSLGSIRHFWNEYPSATIHPPILSL